MELSRAEAAARHATVVLAVVGFGAGMPVSAEAQARFCGYVRAALALVPDARAVVVWNEVNSRTYWRGTPAQYESLLARCYDELHAVRPVQVLTRRHRRTRRSPSSARSRRPNGGEAPGHGRSSTRSGTIRIRSAPTSRPTPAMRATSSARGLRSPRRDAVRTAQRSLAIWYLEDGYQSGIPAGLRRGYTGRENIAVLASPVQAERVGAAIRLAVCQPLVRAFFNFELVDGPDWPAGSQASSGKAPV